MLKKLKKIYLKILGILISLLFFTGNSDACDFPPGVLGKCASPEVIIDKSNYEIIMEFISNNIYYLLIGTIGIIISFIYFIKRKNKKIN